MKRYVRYILVAFGCVFLTTCSPEFTMEDINFRIDVAVENSWQGSTSGSGVYPYGKAITIEAIPAEGYVFLRWDDDDTSNPRTVRVEKAVTYTASFAVDDGGINEYDGTMRGYKYVDLGLPSGLLWATYNIGASSPTKYGDYYAWGETSTQSSYTWSTYDYYNYSSLLTKYCVNSVCGWVDNEITLLPTNDVAYKKWGGKWRMPTEADYQELKQYCTWKWTYYDGVYGYLGKSSKNNKVIFFPAAGYKSSNSSYSTNSYCHYWSSSLFVENSMEAISASWSSSDAPDPNLFYYSHRYYGMPVRAVYGDRSNYALFVAMNDSTMGTVSGDAYLRYEPYSIVTIQATPNAGYELVDWSDGSTENPRTITITKDTYICANFQAEDTGGMGDANGHEYVDLGLPSGTLWATCNIGATSPEQYGDYFAWGEVTPKSNYSWSTYKYCNGTQTTLTKYCTDSQYGYVDNKTQLDLSDDAAYINWGGGWKMPTEEQANELSSQCTWIGTYQDGVFGMLVVGPNGNHIFLPAAGTMSYSGNGYSVGEIGYYWTTKLYTRAGSSLNNNTWARRLNFTKDNNGGYVSSWPREYGCPVRAVLTK